MNFWTAIVILGIASLMIPIIDVIGNMYRARLRMKSTSTNNEDIIKIIERRMDKIEKRMANIETIVLEKEKERRFDSM